MPLDLEQIEARNADQPKAYECDEALKLIEPLLNNRSLSLFERGALSTAVVGLKLQKQYSADVAVLLAELRRLHIEMLKMRECLAEEMEIRMKLQREKAER